MPPQTLSEKAQTVKKMSQNSNLKKNSNMTHFHKLVDKICKYEMDLASIVKDTERTWFCP